jgi:two-component system LytT family sensor kinase
MFLGRYRFYILFSLAYIGFLILEKPYFSINGSWLSFLPTFLVHLLLMMFIVLVNTTLLIPFLLQKKKIVTYIISIIFNIILFTFLRSWYHTYIFEVLFHEKNNDISADFGMSFVYGIWFTVVSSMLYVTQKWFEHSEQVKNIQISQLQTELKYLRSQLNPHFLFNGLNTIYGNIDINNQKARNILVQFSDLLRYNLYEADVDWVVLEKETAYLQNYVDLQRTRSNDNLSIELEINISDKMINIAPLLFIAFVENAFKFSTRGDHTANYVKISLKQTDNQLVFQCINSYEPGKPAEGGIGLNNVKRRLELLYKNRYTLDVKKEQSVYSVELILNL